LRNIKSSREIILHIHIKDKISATLFIVIRYNKYMFGGGGGNNRKRNQLMFLGFQASPLAKKKEGKKG